jgi:UDP-N-acetylglucosamine--N-acetylmuramyl-(pentapeptide) pyrophosphoryl-undecaprenol N-acetylglucosamine transferase
VDRQSRARRHRRPARPGCSLRGRTGPLNILVVGGSLGAQALNEAVPRALALIPESERPRVTHQAGERNMPALEAAYRQAGVTATLAPFIKDMADAYAQADLVICRAGALTVAELAAAGVASVLVPFPHAVDDHQTGNARFLARRRRSGADASARAESASLAA